MAVFKRILKKDRVRTPPKRGFSWIDRRFVHDFAPALSRNAVFLYFFLVSVSDRHGLSYFKDDTIASRTGLTVSEIFRSRELLIHRDLIVWESPLYQVLSLPESGTSRREPQRFAELMSQLSRPSRKEGGV